MPQIRTCAQRGCGRPAVTGSWCWECAHERERQHVPLPVIAWNAPDEDEVA